MNEHILSELEGLIEQEVGNFTNDSAQMEKEVKKLVFSLGKGLIQRLVNRNPNGYKGTKGTGLTMKKNTCNLPDNPLEYRIYSILQIVVFYEPLPQVNTYGR